ncbi:MAG: BatA domain-containing protein [Verrucomicrobia bacterium]|nr:BatA domain-containing protein [Verrucomicrobiota bacterium]
MSFLAPLFLIGGLAVGLPILFHLIRRTIREKQTFSSLMFLLPTPPRVTRHSRLENLLLLALRCLVLCLLALAFSRPFLQTTATNDPSQSGAKQTTLLLDISASMRREDLWAQALRAAEREIDAATPADLLGLYAFDQRLVPLVSLEQFKALPVNERKPRLRQALAALKPGWGSANLGRALIAAAETMEGSGHGAGVSEGAHHIVVVSDLAEGSRLDGLQGHEWPKGLAIRLEAVKARQVTNAGLHLLPARPEDEDAKGGTVVRVRVSNSADSQREQFRLRWEGGTTNTSALEVYVPPGQNRVVTTLATSLESARAILEGDDAGFDNSLAWVPPVAETVSVLYIGADAPTDPNQSGYYLHRAFISTRARSFDVVTKKPAELVAWASGPMAHELAALVCASALDDAQAKIVRDLVASGRTLLYSVSGAAAAPGLAALLGVAEIKVQEAPKRNFSLLAQVDYQSPLFAPFADARFGDFTKIHFWKHRQIDKSTLPREAKVLSLFSAPLWSAVTRSASRRVCMGSATASRSGRCPPIGSRPARIGRFGSLTRRR